ncbi:hypothetical protein FB470_002437 [Amycolatopsis thermophila]|uniref:Uncharacterized protein n=1 Tax=Amycolatopsis thermophila TaxID=206084 RepID=A0ABU0ETN0_9PSEU|nr:hypothetical protein [Amycolatopsis thermophila]
MGWRAVGVGGGWRVGGWRRSTGARAAAGVPRAAAGVRQARGRRPRSAGGGRRCVPRAARRRHGCYPMRGAERAGGWRTRGGEDEAGVPDARGRRPGTDSRRPARRPGVCQRPGCDRASANQHPPRHRRATAGTLRAGAGRAAGHRTATRRGPTVTERLHLRRMRQAADLVPAIGGLPAGPGCVNVPVANRASANQHPPRHRRPTAGTLPAGAGRTVGHRTATRRGPGGHERFHLRGMQPAGPQRHPAPPRAGTPCRPISNVPGTASHRPGPHSGTPEHTATGPNSA